MSTTSLSATSTCYLLIFLLILTLLLLSPSSSASTIAMKEAPARNLGQDQHQHDDDDDDDVYRHGYCDSFSHGASRSLCIRLHRAHGFRSLHTSAIPKPLVSDYQNRRRRRHENTPGNTIDPRYGIEKRLVPSGPNPLHN